MSSGYAQIGWGGNSASRGTVLAHRAAWVAANGQVPLGMTLDHTCKVRRCVNPAHLRMLPNYENARRVDGQDWAMGFCKRGHANSNLQQYPRAGRLSLECSLCRKARIARNNWTVRHPDEPLPERLRDPLAATTQEALPASAVRASTVSKEGT